MTAGIRSRRASRLRDRRSARLRRSGSVALVGALIAALSIGAVPAFAVGTPTPTPDASSTSEPTPEATEPATSEATPESDPATPTPDVVEPEGGDDTSSIEPFQSRLAPDPDSSSVTPFAVINTECGTSSACVGMRITNVVVGGTASVSDWTLKAVRNNASADEFVFSSGQTRTLPRNTSQQQSVYTLSATADAAIQSRYVTTFSCSRAPSPRNATTVNTEQRTVTYSTQGTGGPSDRYAYCTFTHTANFATIRAQVGGDRVGLSDVSALAGVVLRLYNGTSSAPTTALTEAWATCTSDASGRCSFEVPLTGAGGVGPNFQPWVVQQSVPVGWFANADLRTGDGDGGNSAATPYRFRLKDTLSAGQTYSSLVTGENGFMLASGDTNRTASGGVWQQSRNNPVLPAQCGLDVALVLDFSGSVANAGEVPNLKSAAKSITNGLVGTQSRAALFSFSTSSPGAGSPAKANYPGLTSVATQAQADAFTARWSDWNATGGTNWDRALSTVAQAAPVYDVVVVITDGNPTFYASGEGYGPGNFNRLREMENAIFSANAIKAENSRMIAVGVGSGATNATTGLNLAAISGQVKYNGSNPLTADYYQESTYEAAAAAIRAMALGNCASSVSVTKMIVPAGTTGEGIAGAVTAPAGWTFNASVTAGTVTGPTKTTTNDGTGTVNFPIVLPAGVNSTAATIAETQQPGYQLVTRAGKNAVCVRQDTGAAVTVTNSGALGFTADVPATTGVSCTVYNREPNQQASITLDKQWIIDGAAPVRDGEQPGDFQAVGQLSGPAGAGLSEQGWGVERTGYAVGDRVILGEDYTQASGLMCQLTSAAITKLNAATVNIPLVSGRHQIDKLSAGNTTVVITNVVECDTELILRKRVADRSSHPAGSAEPGLWTLSAIAPSGAVAGPSGQSTSLSLAGAGTDPRGAVTPGATYQLAESGGDARYVQTDERSRPLLNPQSTGSMTCVRLDPVTDAELSGFSDGIQGGVAVPRGYLVRCTANNETSHLTLLKHIEGEATFTAADWNLTAMPAANAFGLTAETVEGAEVDQGLSTFRVRPGHPYTLTEALAAAGNAIAYQQLRVEKLVDGGWTEVDAGATVVLTPGADATYRFVNAAVPPIVLPLTGGTASDLYLLLGGAILSAVISLGAFQAWRRSRRITT